MTSEPRRKEAARLEPERPSSPRAVPAPAGSCLGPEPRTWGASQTRAVTASSEVCPANFRPVVVSLRLKLQPQLFRDTASGRNFLPTAVPRCVFAHATVSLAWGRPGIPRVASSGLPTVALVAKSMKGVWMDVSVRYETHDRPGSVPMVSRKSKIPSPRVGWNLGRAKAPPARDLSHERRLSPPTK